MTRLVLIIWAFLASSAAGETVTCHIEQLGRNSGWIAQVVTIKINDQRTKAQISDAVTSEYAGGPVWGELIWDTDEKLVVSWVVEGRNVEKRFVMKGGFSQRFARMRYHLAYFRTLGTATVEANPNAHVFKGMAPGTCAVNK